MSSAPYQQPGYSPPPNPYQAGMSPEKPSPSGNEGCGWTTCLLGCLGITVILGLAFCGGAWYVYNNAGKWGADIARNMIVSVVNESELTPEDKQGVIAQVDRVTDAYKQGKITMQEVGQVMESLAKSPLMPMIMVYAVEEQYIKNSGLSDEEKAEAHITLQRLMRGAFDKKISEQELDAILDDVSYKGPNNQREIKQNLTDAEVRAFLAKAKKLADEKEIPEDEIKLDIVGEIKKAVDEGLKGKG